EEHGLHLWMGFYENAFRIMRDCYAELATIPGKRRFRDWTDAFAPAPNVAVVDRAGDGAASWQHWVAHFPPGVGLPGDPVSEGSPFTVARYLRQSAMLVAELLRSASELEQRRRSSVGETVLRYGRLATTAALYESADLLRQAIETWIPPKTAAPADGVLRLV